MLNLMKARRALARFFVGLMPALLSVHALAAEPSFEPLYDASCSACHGKALEGSATGVPLLGPTLRHGTSIEEVVQSISGGFPQSGMPAMAATLDAGKIRGLAILVAERRQNLSYGDFKVNAKLEIPKAVQTSELQNFRIETVVSDLDAFPYSIAPLPDGSILLTEKTKGLSIISPQGVKSPLITGTPKVFDDSFKMPGLLFIIGNGWLMDVAIDPDYAKNGWVYLHYGDRCSDCNAMSRDTKKPVSMNKLVRGRIRDGKWVDQATLWQADIEQYTWMTDQGAGGRIAFDDKNHIFISIGMKGAGEQVGIQDLSLPYGKIHRINRDGSIPADNPFVHTKGAMPSIYTYGHRSPQGLEYNARTQQLWGTEMGPRGGDEVNLLKPGKNYGWPLYSKGINYDGNPIAYGKSLGIDFKLEDIEQPVVDLTPAPAVSSFIFYEGKAFPKWQHNMLVGTLKATDLYRMVVDGEKVVQRETVLSGMGRIRDIATAPDGSVLLLIEHLGGGKILRLVPAK